MIIHPRPGPAEPASQGAKILVFKPPKTAMGPLPTVPVESGSGWYHEAAIREAAAPQGCKR